MEDTDGWPPGPRGDWTAASNFERTKTLEREGRPAIFLETGKPGLDTLAHVPHTLRG